MWKPLAEVDADAEEAPDESELPGASASAEIIAATDEQAAAIWRIMRESKGIINPEEARRKVPLRKQSMLHVRIALPAFSINIQSCTALLSLYDDARYTSALLPIVFQSTAWKCCFLLGCNRQHRIIWHLNPKKAQVFGENAYENQSCFACYRSTVRSSAFLQWCFHAVCYLRLQHVARWIMFCGCAYFVRMVELWTGGAIAHQGPKPAHLYLVF